MNLRPRTWYWMAIALVVAGFWIAGCGSVPREPVVKIERVPVPVAVSCVPEGVVEAQPTYKDSDAALKAAPDMAERYRLLAGEHAVHQVRETELEAIVKGCRLAPTP
jgi:hypothetical protein